MEEQQQQTQSSAKISGAETITEQKSKKSKLVPTLLTLVLLLSGAAGYLGYLVMSDEDELTPDNTSQLVMDEGNEKPAEADPAESILEGFTKYNNEILALSLNWPDEWLEFSPEVNEADGYVVEYRYNQDVKYIVSADYSSWNFVPEEGYEGEGVASEPYVSRRTKDYTIWANSFGDAGCGGTTYLVLVKDKILSFGVPTTCGIQDDQGNFLDEGVEAYIGGGGEEKIIYNPASKFSEVVNSVLDSIVIK